jgi:uncharacterized protein (DUF488 family)
MEILLCTIGFAGKTAEEFFGLLKSAGVRTVIDIRQNRIGQLSGFAKFPDIVFLLGRVAGIEYRQETVLAPTPEILKAYRKSRDWALYEAAFLALMKERGVPDQIAPAGFEGTAALLCSEPGPEKCHRRLVADLLAAQWRAQNHSVEIRHLVVTREAVGNSVKKRKKKFRADDDAASD